MKAISFGVNDEKSLHGFAASVVFSYGDLEANFQGLRFYRNMFDGKSSYLTQTDGEWRLRYNPNISDYITPYFDESWNHSYFLKRTLKKFRIILKKFVH